MDEITFPGGSRPPMVLKKHPYLSKGGGVVSPSLVYVRLLKQFLIWSTRQVFRQLEPRTKGQQEKKVIQMNP